MSPLSIHVEHELIINPDRLLISSWYKPSEIALRVAIVYCGNTVANGFGGLLAAGIMSGLGGKGGLEGWRLVTYPEPSIQATN